MSPRKASGARLRLREASGVLSGIRIFVGGEVGLTRQIMVWLI